ncbi:MAG: hypothetical protein FJ294_10585 [Planctomycetes bacterium]|nr:hypothetical protein [Planctomycetota bacterium]
MQRRTYLIASLALVLMAFLWVAWRLERDAADARPGGEQAQSALPREPAEARLVQELSVGELSAPQRDLVTAGGGTLEGVVLALRVLASGTLDPVAEAEVLWWPSPDPRQGDSDELVRRLLRSAESRTLLASARRTTSDARGVAVVGDAEHGVLVLARADGRLGIARFVRGESPPREVILQSDFVIEARVLDESGLAVAGIDVELRPGDDERTHMSLRERSGADGLVRFEHAGFACASWSEGAEVGTIAVAEPVEPAAEFEFALADPPQTPVELVVQAGGECEVRIVDEQGRPASGIFDVILGYLPGDDMELEELDPNWLQGARRSAVEGPSVLFRRVQSGRDVLASVLRRGRPPVHRAIGAGPVDAKSRSVIEVRLGNACTLVSGRVVADSGSPRQQVLLDLRVESESFLGGVTLASPARSDSDGRFEFEVESAQWAQLGEIALRLVELDAERGEVAEASQRVVATAGERRVDLGELELAERAPYASGRVVTNEFVPVCGAWVMAAMVHDDLGAADESALDALPNSRVLTDALGRFELRLGQGGSASHLLAGKGELRSMAIRTSSGAQDLQIVLQPRAEIAGRLMLDATLAVTRVLVIATRTNASIDGERVVRVRPEPDGRFVVRGVSAGEHSVSVHAVEGYAELGRVDGVFAIAGERTLDARLDPLDLRAGHRSVSIALRDESGALFAGEVSVIVRTAHATGERASFAPIAQGVASVLVGEKPPLVTVFAPGHLAQILEAVDSDRSVRLGRAPQLRFTLAAGVELPPLPFRLALQFRPVSVSARDLTRNFPQPEFAGDRIARCDATLAGKLQVTVHLVRRTEDSWNEVELPLEQPLVIDVRERGEQAFEVRCTPESLASALRALGAR